MLIKAGKNNESGKEISSKKENLTISEGSNYKASDITLTTNHNFSTSGSSDYWEFCKGENFTITSNVGAIAHVYISCDYGNADELENATGSGTYKYHKWKGKWYGSYAVGCWRAENNSTYSVTIQGKKDNNVKVLWVRVDYVSDKDVSVSSLDGEESFDDDSKSLQFNTNYKYSISRTKGATPSTDATSSTKIPINNSCWVSARQEVNVKIGQSGSTDCGHIDESYATYSKIYEKHFIQTWNVTTSSALHSDGYSYATFCHKNIMRVPANCTAYAYSKSGNLMKPNTAKPIGTNSYIPASLPVIIRYNTKNAVSQTLTFTNPDGNTATTVSVSNGAPNVFCGNPNKGSLANSDTNYKYYYLMKDSRGGLNFLRYSSNTCPGHACYVRLSASAAAKGFVFEFPDDDGGTTGIGGVTTARPAYDPSAPMYNAAGQRVGASYKGIVIQNGRKFIKR